MQGKQIQFIQRVLLAQALRNSVGPITIGLIVGENKRILTAYGTVVGRGDEALRGVDQPRQLFRGNITVPTPIAFRPRLADRTVKTPAQRIAAHQGPSDMALVIGKDHILGWPAGTVYYRHRLFQRVGLIHFKQTQINPCGLQRRPVDRHRLA